MKKVLALGYIPKWRGGEQLTGLATGLFDLHNAVNQVSNEYRVVIAATDIYETEKQIDSTVVIGWSRSILIKHSLKYCYRLLLFFIKAITISSKYSNIHFFDTFIKMVFLDYAIEREKPDIIHLHGATYALYIKAIWRKKIPVVLRLHGLNGSDCTIPFYDQFARIEKDIVQLPFSLVTFVTSKICAEWQEKYGRFHCPMVPILNGFNSEVFYIPEVTQEKKYNLITIAGISERKGQGRVIEALKRLRDSTGVNLSYLVVGQGDMEYVKKIKQFVKEYLLDVHFLDYCPQIELNHLLWKSSFFIQPSASEGFGKSYIEAIAAGVPCILPKTLPIAQEPNILSEINSVFTEDEGVESIFSLLSQLNSYSFDSYSVSNSISHLKWTSIAKDYIQLYNSLNE